MLCRQDRADGTEAAKEEHKDIKEEEHRVDFSSRIIMRIKVMEIPTINPEVTGIEAEINIEEIFLHEETN